MDDLFVMGQSDSKQKGNAAPKEMNVSMLLSALEYVSQKLWQKTKTHHTLIASGGVVFVLLFRSRPTTADVSVLQASHLDDKTKTVLVAAIKRAAEKYSLPNSWLNNDAEKHVSAMDFEDAISRSLAQKETVFSSEGLSLIAVDFFYALKTMLLDLSKTLEEDVQLPEQQNHAPTSEETEQEQSDPVVPEGTEVMIGDMVQLLRRLVSVENRGKTVERSEIDQVYPNLKIPDEAIESLQRAYKARFGEQGIILGQLSDQEEWSDCESAGSQGEGEEEDVREDVVQTSVSV